MCCAGVTTPCVALGATEPLKNGKPAPALVRGDSATSFDGSAVATGVGGAKPSFLGGLLQDAQCLKSMWFHKQKVRGAAAGATGSPSHGKVLDCRHSLLSPQGDTHEARLASFYESQATQCECTLTLTKGAQGGGRLQGREARGVVSRPPWPICFFLRAEKQRHRPRFPPPLFCSSRQRRNAVARRACFQLIFHLFPLPHRRPLPRPVPARPPPDAGRPRRPPAHRPPRRRRRLGRPGGRHRRKRGGHGRVFASVFL